MLERKERSGGEVAGPRGLPAVRSTLQQCGLLQDLIDISLSNLRGLRTKCAASNDLTQQEIRTLEVRHGLAAAGAAAGPRCRPCPARPGPRPGPAAARRPVPSARCSSRGPSAVGGGSGAPAPLRSCQRARCSRRGSGSPARESRGAERGAGGARTGAGQPRGAPGCRAGARELREAALGRAPGPVAGCRVPVERDAM